MDTEMQPFHVCGESANRTTYLDSLESCREDPCQLRRSFLSQPHHMVRWQWCGNIRAGAPLYQAAAPARAARLGHSPKRPVKMTDGHPGFERGIPKHGDFQKPGSRGSSRLGLGVVLSLLSDPGDLHGALLEWLKAGHLQKRPDGFLRPRGDRSLMCTTGVKALASTGFANPMNILGYVAGTLNLVLLGRSSSGSRCR